MNAEISKKSCLTGAAKQIDITPQTPVKLCGQYYKRTAEKVYTPLGANILVLDGERGESAIFVSCDLLGIPSKLIERIRTIIADTDSGIDTSSIIVSATHIHTGPYLTKDTMSVFWGDDFSFHQDSPDETDPEAYSEDLAQKIAAGIVEAWKERRTLSISSDFDHICISYNRRTVYRDGHAEMYGSTAKPDFMMIEGTSDCGIHFIVLRDESGNIIASVIETACPAQIMEHKTFITSDYWNLVREKLYKIYKTRFPVVALCGAAGDLSPRDLIRTAMNEEDMHSTKMYNHEGMELVSDKIVSAFVNFERNSEVISEASLHHRSAVLELPLRRVTIDDVAAAKISYEKLRSKHESIDDFSEYECMMLSIYAAIINREKLQKLSDTYPIEIHCVKIANTVILTNPFELFVYYADLMRASSGFPNTMVVQLTNGYEGYLPTKRAVEGGGYSSYVCNGILGPDGGEELVQETMKLLDSIKQII